MPSPWCRNRPQSRWECWALSHLFLRAGKPSDPNPPVAEPFPTGEISFAHQMTSQITSNPAQSCEAGQCPLCGGPNGCQLCTTAAYKGSCWCMTANIPDELLARVPGELRNRACICSKCVASFHRQRLDVRPLPIVPGDSYYDAG